MVQNNPTHMQRRLIPLTTPAGTGTIAGFELGPPNRPLDILFLHANGFNALTYRHVFAELNPELRLLAVDLRGHGRTTLPIPDPHPGWQIYADDLLALIAAMGETPPLIAGHSMGASAALLAAPNLPKAAKMILFDPVIAALKLRAAARGQPLWDQPFAQAALRRRASFPSRQDAFDAYDGRGAFRTWQEAMLRDYVEDGLKDDPAGGLTLACPPAWEAANFATFGIADPAAGLQRCQSSVLIFQAAHGSTCALDRVPPSTRLEVLPGTSHFLPMERPGIVCKAINDAL